jgi:hypothetical protein
MGKSRHTISICSVAASLLAALLLVGCATGPIAGSHYADRAIRPEDAAFVFSRQRDDLRFRKYVLVEQFPNPANITAGMPSHAAFDQLGKATGMEVGISSFPPVETVLKTQQDVAIEWRAIAYWSLARRHSDKQIETADIAVRFVKVTRTMAEIQYVGSPLIRGLDQGWFIEQINVFPLMHNLDKNAKRR